jgi:restriction system protein
VARRGFFAELEYQSRVRAQQQARASREAVRLHNAAVRQAEQARKTAERARVQAARATEAERKRLEKEAKEAHLAAMEAEVAERNATLTEIYDAVDSLLAATLEVDDYVDLETLRIPTEHPPFDRADLEAPIPPPAVILDPPEPQIVEPPAPTGLGSLFGKKKRAEALATAGAAHEQAIAAWRAACAAAADQRTETAARHAEAEADRLAKLEAEQARYAVECAAREAETTEHHKALDELIANLGYGTVEAVQEYVAIVLSHSVYPDHFPVSHDFSFDPATSELTLRVAVPDPGALPDVKAYRYTKASDTIAETKLPQREIKERYAGAVHQVALRSLHEIFEADRRGLIKTISVEVGTQTIDRATGQQIYVPFVAVGAHRDAFLSFDLSAVIPSATLGHLGASVSKDPYGLMPAALDGIRRS